MPVETASRVARTTTGRGGLLARKRHRELLLIWLLLTPALLIFLAYRILPLLWNGVLSFQFWSPTKPAEWAGLFHYEEMFVYDDVFWTSLYNTFLYMLTAPISIGIAVVLALMVNSRIRGRGVYRTIIFLSYPLMVVAVGIIWRWLYDERVGLINYLLRQAGLIDEPIAFLESYGTALPSVIAAAIWQITGFFMIILLTGLQNIPPSLYEAASIDGASRWSQFWRITLPLLRPSIFICFVIAIIASFTSFDLIYVMTGGGPGHATELLITYIYKAAFTLSQFDYAGALTIVMFVLFVGIALLGNLLAGGDAGKVDIAE
ncbi:MAG: sugar ABC transporter permease [Geminicoccaceae bacterium]|nr:sugar ABC transporter permease [Geminicoccaceae bacterium]